MTSIQSLPLYLLKHISSCGRDGHPLTENTRGIITEYDPDGGVSPAIIHLSSCNRFLRRLLFSFVFETIRIGQYHNIRTTTYKREMKWLLESGNHILATAEQLVLMSFKPDAFSLANECISRMLSLRKYTHASSLAIPGLFVSTLHGLPRLSHFTMYAAGVESFSTLTALSHKIVSLEFILGRHHVYETDCLDVSPRILEPEPREDGSSSPGDKPSLEDYCRALSTGLSRFLAANHEKLEILFFDTALGYKDGIKLEWFQESHRLAKELGSLSFPKLKRLSIEAALFTPDLLQEIFNSSPFITHLALASLRKKDSEMDIRSLPLLKTLNIFFGDVPKQYPKFLSSLTAGATLEHVYFNGITPPDLGTFVRSDKFCSALSLRTLEVIFDDESPLRASHFKTLAQTCINLVKLKFGAALFFSNPPEYFATLSQLPRLAEITFNHSWDSRIVDVSPLMMHDGRSIRSESMGNFRVISCRGNSINEEVRSRIRDDLDGVRSLYVRRFGAIARAHRSLQTIVWNPSAEVEWTWNFFRSFDNKVTFKEHAEITFNKGPQGDIPQSAVLMLA